MSKVVKIRDLGVGGDNPVRIKGMLKSPTEDRRALLKEARKLEKEGAEAIRVAVKNEKDTHLAGYLAGKIGVPLVADIHFHPRLALGAIENGFDSIRLNPLNIHRKSDVKKIARAAKKRKIPIRVGINSGGFRGRFSSPKKLALKMVRVAQDYLNILESQDFFDIMVSLKGSDVPSTIIANKIFAEKKDYPVHLGITATGNFLEGVVKSCTGIGNLLYSGIGDIIRVSLAAPSFWEVRVAKDILQALGLRRFGPEIVSCPTCSRCEVDLIGITNKFKRTLDREGLKRPLRIALMGCIVNGPGEASQADIGAAFGKKKALIFKGNKIIAKSSPGKIIEDLIRGVREL